jgi:hypothetical protein
MRKPMIAAAALLALVVSACATPTVYAPALSPRAEGFSEQQLESNRFIVTVRGNYITSQNRVENMLLLRAAELTLANGFDHFVLTGRDTQANRRLAAEPGSSLRFTFGGGWYSPRWGWSAWSDPYWGGAPEYREISRFEARAEVAMFKGAKPAGNADAYDAASIKQSLAPISALPTQKAN